MTGFEFLLVLTGATTLTHLWMKLVHAIEGQ